MKKLGVLLILLVWSFPAVVFPSTNASTQEKIKTLDKKINVVQNNLVRDTTQTHALETDLKTTEIALGQLHQELNEISRVLQSQTTLLEGLNTKQKILEDNLEQQNTLLAQQLVHHYILGKQNDLKLILNEEDPVLLGRNLQYYRYMNEARQALIVKVRKTASQLKTNETQLRQKTQELTLLAQQKEKNISQLNNHHRERDKILVALKQDIQNNAQQLMALNQDKKTLLALIQHLNTQSKTQPVIQPPLSLTRLKGTLPWPTEGILQQKYGTSIQESQLTYTGVFLRAPQGQAIHTIYPGKVVFAGWLKGYGLLTIVDHGGGYMSLYAHSQSLYRQVGDLVKAGDLIATVGKTGGFHESGLYFEIRYKGMPLNPELWCSRKDSSQLA